MSSEKQELPLENGIFGDYLQQMEDSVGDLIFGLFLITVMASVMWLVEKHAVNFILIMHRCETACRVVRDTSYVNSQYEGRPILIQGKTRLNPNSSNTNFDRDTGFMVNQKQNGLAIRLKRVAEMYQWVETKNEKKEGKKTTVYYTYDLKWCENDHNSNLFHGANHNDSGEYHGVEHSDSTTRSHKNPAQRNPPIESETRNGDVWLNSYQLSSEQINMIVDFKNVTLTREDIRDQNVVGSIEKDEESSKSYLVYKASCKTTGASLKDPEVGLVRVGYSVVYEGGDVTTVGVSQGKTFRAFNEEDAHNIAPGSNDLLSCITGKSAPVATVTNARYVDLESANPESANPNDGYVSNEDEETETSNNGSIFDVLCCPLFACPCCLLTRVLQPCLDPFIGAIVGKEVLLLEEARVGIKSMFTHADDAFKFKMKIVRIVSVVIFWYAIALIFSPISSILSFIPLIGGLANSAFSLLTAILGITLACLIIAFAWVAFHPEALMGGLLFIGISCWWTSEASSYWILFGQFSCICSLYPLLLWMNKMREEHAFNSEQEEFTQEMSMHEKSSLVK